MSVAFNLLRLSLRTSPPCEAGVERIAAYNPGNAIFLRCYVRFLIDGYNLMHVTGHLSGLTKGKLEPARRRFLDWLATGAGGRGATIRVAFDGQKAPAPSLETIHRGVRVRFAYRQTADDLIEEFIRDEPDPTPLIVISNDTRLHESARRGGANFWSCQRFIDWIVQPPPPANAAEVTPVEEKPPGQICTAIEDELLKVFSEPRAKRTK